MVHCDRLIVFGRYIEHRMQPFQGEKNIAILRQKQILQLGKGRRVEKGNKNLSKSDDIRRSVKDLRVKSVELRKGRWASLRFDLDYVF